ncbi:hypothetical protein [Tenacibaculum amylolyticum]|uniref:hypothetical protein n=1 Tax=Tenacibaculum amylolyticum TaxID=104269 RepID=UPI0038956A46
MITAIEKDPYWDRYFQWPTDYFPFNLPACHLSKTQEQLTDDTTAKVTWTMDTNLELECWLVSENKEIIAKLTPVSSEETTNFTVEHYLNEEDLKGKIGFTFIWAYYIPCPSYISKHPMGIIQIDGSELKGKNTIIRIVDTR